jgi:hypothetical protein
MLDAIDFMTVQQHKEEGDWPIEWLPVKGLIPYIRRLGPSTVGIEIGVARAESSYAILENCNNVARLFGIDSYTPYQDWNGFIDQEHNDKTMEIALENMKEFGYRWELIRKTSDEAYSDGTFIEDYQVNFVYIDGDHSYEGAKKDMTNYYNMVQPGGIFAGHDYNLATVRRALEEFRSENKIRIPINHLDNNTWFWYKP